MDGGRVFRSLLAMFLNYGKATWIASRVGLLCAAGMAFFALNSGLYIPVLIAIFIGYAGLAEAKQVDTMESVRGLNVKQAMIPTKACILMETPLSQIMRSWQSNPVSVLPVVTEHGMITGMSTSGVHERCKGKMHIPVVTYDPKIILVRPSSTNHENAIQRGSRQIRQIPVADQSGCLMGILDLDSMVVRAQLATSQQKFQRIESSMESGDMLQSQMVGTQNLQNSPNHFDQTN